MQTAPDSLAPLIADLLEWLAPGPRPYSEVMDAWRTSCPRLTVFEDAMDRGYIARHAAGPDAAIALTAKGRAWLAAQRGCAWQAHRRLVHAAPRKG